MSPVPAIELVECPRDAMQGIDAFIPTEEKVAYLQTLLAVGFHSLDFGSFVSAKAIPQLRDTEEVLAALDLSNTDTRLLAIVANLRGARQALQYDKIHALGYPFSISETFQKRNTNKGLAESREIVTEIKKNCDAKGKELVIYVSMGFGNPYGEPWSVEIVEQCVADLVKRGIRTISLSDTIGSSTPESIDYLFRTLIPRFPQVKFGAHLHTTPLHWHQKLAAAYDAGCRRFDGAIKGLGGCPMAEDELVGNMPTEKLLTFAEERKIAHGLKVLAFESAYNQALKTFPTL